MNGEFKGRWSCPSCKSNRYWNISTIEILERAQIESHQKIKKLNFQCVNCGWVSAMDIAQFSLGVHQPGNDAEESWQHATHVVLLEAHCTNFDCNTRIRVLAPCGLQAGAGGVPFYYCGWKHANVDVVCDKGHRLAVPPAIDNVFVIRTNSVIN